MLKYCGDELDPKRRTLLDYHPVEVAQQMALAARADFCARATERADVARLDEGCGRRATRATARTSSASSNQFNRISRWVASEIVRVTDDAPQHAQSLHRAGALLPRRAEPARHVRVHVDLNQWAVQRLKGLWEKLPT
jgi:hypothetical protein